MISTTLPVPTAKTGLGSNQTKGVDKYVIAARRKSARRDGYMLGLEAINRYRPQFTKDDELMLVIHVYHKSGVHLDDDNLITSLKPYRDGIFDALKAKFGLADNKITRTVIDTSYRDKTNPRVEWKLSVRQKEKINLFDKAA